MANQRCTQLIEKLTKLADLGQCKLKATEDAVRWARGALNGARREIQDDYFFGICYRNTMAYVTYAAEQTLEAYEVVNEAKTLFRLIEHTDTTGNGTHGALQHLQRTIAFADLANENAKEARSIFKEVYQLKTLKDF